MQAIHRSVTESNREPWRSLFFCLLFISFNAAAQTYADVLVLRVSDGDTDVIPKNSST